MIDDNNFVVGYVIGVIFGALISILVILADDAHSRKEFGRLLTEGKYGIKINITFGLNKNITNLEFVKYN